MSNLEKYIAKLKKLRQGVTQYGKAPHKIVLLITLIEQIANGKAQENKFYLTPELVGSFKDNFTFLVNTQHKSDFLQPFYYLTSDKLWHLKTFSGEPLSNFIRSFIVFEQNIEYGYFDEDLFLILSNQSERDLINTILLDTYFPETRVEFIKNKGKNSGYIQDLENYLLNESPIQYKNILQNDEEEKYVRGGLFKKLVPQVYNNTCCFTGMKLISSQGYSMIDACHIIPFSISNDDKVTNGLALCPNLHRAFDRGLVSLDEKLQIIVSQSFAENENSDYSLNKLSSKKVILPFGKQHYPSLENIKWHRENIFK